MKNIIKTVLCLAITSGVLAGLLVCADGVAKDGTRFTTTSDGSTVIDHSGRGSGGGISVVPAKNTTTSN